MQIAPGDYFHCWSFSWLNLIKVMSSFVHLMTKPNNSAAGPDVEQFETANAWYFNLKNYRN